MIEDNPQQVDASDKIFTLDNDQLDSIVLESQSISPAEKQKLDNLIAEANQKLSVEFGAIVSPLTDTEVQKRMLFADKETMDALELAWDPSSDANRSYIRREESTGRTFSSEGRFVVSLPGSTELWDHLKESNKQILIEDNGTEEKAKETVKRAVDMNIALHEGTHMYQIPLEDDRINREYYLLRESQAHWAARELAEVGEKYHQIDMDRRADFYENLMSKYGRQKVHEYALTGNIQDDPWLTFDIDGEFTEEVSQALFPNLTERASS